MLTSRSPCPLGIFFEFFWFIFFRSFNSTAAFGCFFDAFGAGGAFFSFFFALVLVVPAADASVFFFEFSTGKTMLGRLAFFRVDRLSSVETKSMKKNNIQIYLFVKLICYQRKFLLSFTHDFWFLLGCLFGFSH